LTDRAILEAGREIVVVADHTKVNTVSAAFLAPITAIHTFVTDSETPVGFLANLKEHGITVHVA
jgi:DeoR/GlpR family transcriptional regulator of sugar metabolism